MDIVGSAVAQGCGSSHGEQLSLKLRWLCCTGCCRLQTAETAEILHLQVPPAACCSIAQERMKWLWCVACMASRHLKGQWPPLPQCPQDFKLVFNPLQRRSWPGWEEGQEKQSDWIQIILSMCDICDAWRAACNMLGSLCSLCCSPVSLQLLLNLATGCAALLQGSSTALDDKTWASRPLSALLVYKANLWWLEVLIDLT